MKRFQFLLVSVIIVLATGAPPVSAAISKGQKCQVTKANKVIKSGSNYLICKKTSQNYQWNLSNRKAFKAYKLKIREAKLAKANAEFEAQRDAQAAEDAQAAQAAQAAEAAEAKQDIEKNQSIGMGASYKCVVGKYCSIGNTGPGGGIVFYGDGIAGSGKHFEAAQTVGNDLILPYCIPKIGAKTREGYDYNGLNDYIMGVPDKAGYIYYSRRIGDGPFNTKMMLTKCSDSAANFASEFKGGGLSDWFLPSVALLQELWLHRELISGLQGVGYWSSSEDTKSTAFYFSMDASGSFISDNKAARYSVRPVRKF